MSAATVAGGISGVRLTATGAGSLPFPSYIVFTSVDDYDAVVVEGPGVVDVKNLDSVDVTDACIVRIEPLKTNCVSHLS